MKLKDLKSTKNYQKHKDNLFTIGKLSFIVDKFIVHDLLYESSFLHCGVVLANASMISLFYMFKNIATVLHDRTRRFESHESPILLLRRILSLSLLIVLSAEQIVTTSNRNILHIAVKFGGDNKCRTPLYAGCHVSFLLSTKFE